MPARIEDEEIFKICESFGYSVIKQYSLYVGNKYRRRIVVKDSDGFLYDSELWIVTTGKAMKKVHKSNPFSIENIQKWIEINEKDFYLKSGNIYVADSEKLVFSCGVCGDDFINSWKSIFQNSGCGKCHGLQVGKFNNLEFTHKDLILEWDESNDFYPNSVTRGSHKKVVWKCSKCSSNWTTPVKDRAISLNGCPKCRESRGEKEISSILRKMNIEFFSEYSKFENCSDERNLRFDFFIPKHNLCIEYNGRQHYEAVDFGNMGIDWAKKEFIKNKRHDRIKIKYCKENGIKLLVIPYWEMKNIEKIIENEIYNKKGGR